MAAEASRSSSEADSYIGSLISVISKSEIRYEGILFNLNITESSFGLRMVRSFGTEGRKKDGAQVPPSDKVYDYIMFRGSDIKDLQVKSSPPVQTMADIYNDPAIIQTHYPQEAATSTSLPLADTGFQQDPKLTQLSSVPLYQPSATPSGSCGSLNPSSATKGSRLPMPIYSQGFYGASDGLHAQQQSLVQSPTGLLMPPSVQQTPQYPAISASLPSRGFNFPASPLLHTPPPLLPSFSTGILNTSFPLVTTPTTVLDKNAFAAAGVAQPKTADLATMSYNSVLESQHHIAGTSGSFSNMGLSPSFVTPNQLLQPGPTVVSSSQPSKSVQKDVEVVQVSSTEKPLPTLPDAQAPLLPLPTLPDAQVRGDPSHTPHNNRRLGRARGHWASQNVNRFTEDFDFDAMNGKFNKEEVWGHLGKTNTAQEDGYSQDEDDAGTSNFESKPVYMKDDFFDSLSYNASGGARNGRANFSEQVKLDNKRFGNSARHRGGYGGRRSDRGGVRVVRAFDHDDHGFDHRGHGGPGFDRGGHGIDRGGYGNGRGFVHTGQSRGGHGGGAQNRRSYGYNDGGGSGHHAT